jgi:hypothetical protein
LILMKWTCQLFAEERAQVSNSLHLPFLNRILSKYLILKISTQISSQTNKSLKALIDLRLRLRPNINKFQKMRKNILMTSRHLIHLLLNQLLPKTLSTYFSLR